MPTTMQAQEAIERIRAKRPQSAPVKVCLQPSLWKDLQDAQTSGDAEGIVAVQNQIEDASVVLTITSVGRQRHDEFALECPPSDEQNAEVRAANGTNAPYDIDRFAPLLTAASIAATEFSPYREEDDWRELTASLLPEVQTWIDEWNVAEFLPLWTTTVAVNNASQTRLVGKASG